ncbi:MAG: hypothetical protein ACOC3V_02705 [bacterium]
MNKLQYQKILDAVNKITRSSRTGASNYVIANSYAIEIYLERLKEYEKMRQRIKKLKKISSKL